MNAVFAVLARHIETREEVTFLVVAASQAAAGWPILESIANYNDFRPEQVDLICSAQDRERELVDYYGATTLVQKKRPEPAAKMKGEGPEDTLRTAADIVARSKGVTLGGLKIKDLIHGRFDE